MRKPVLSQWNYSCIVYPIVKYSLMPAVHSRWGNPRQGGSESVDGKTRLALDPLVQPWHSCLALLKSRFLSGPWARVKGSRVSSGCRLVLRAKTESSRQECRESHSPSLVSSNSRKMHWARVHSRHNTFFNCGTSANWWNLIQHILQTSHLQIFCGPCQGRVFGSGLWINIREWSQLVTSFWLTDTKRDKTGTSWPLEGMSRIQGFILRLPSILPIPKFRGWRDGNGRGDILTNVFLKE